VKKLALLISCLLVGSCALSAAHVDAKGKRRQPAFGPRTFSIVQQSFPLSGPDAQQRLEVHCPNQGTPYGGAMSASPTPLLNGEGVYPHSYERLGIQHGWHVTTVLFAPLPVATPRTATMQVICGPWAGRVLTGFQSTFVGPGQTQTAVATCPNGTRIFSGGFQRTDFASTGGVYVTESRAISDRSWSVTGHAHGTWGGEMAAMAYCMASRRDLVTEVSADATEPSSGVLGLLHLHSYLTATTPACSPGSQMVSGGFSENGSTAAFFADGTFNPDGTWSASAFDYFGGAPTRLTAYAYCLPLALAHFAQHGNGAKIPHQKVVQAPPILDAAFKSALRARAGASDGCYPAAAALASQIRQDGVSSGVAANVHAVGGAGTVYVLENGGGCDRVLLATRAHGAVILIDSRTSAVTKH
jgi:hypothetical protein